MQRLAVSGRQGSQYDMDSPFLIDTSTAYHITQEVEQKITEISLMRINNGGKDVHRAGSDHSKRLNKPSVPVYFWQIWSYVGLTIAVQISISFNNGLQYILLVAKQIFVQLIDNMMINNRVLEER